MKTLNWHGLQLRGLVSFPDRTWQACSQAGYRRWCSLFYISIFRNQEVKYDSIIECRRHQSPPAEWHIYFNKVTPPLYMATPFDLMGSNYIQMTTTPNSESRCISDSFAWSLDSFPFWGVVLSSLHVRAFVLSFYILFGPLWLLYLGGLLFFLKRKWKSGYGG